MSTDRTETQNKKNSFRILYLYIKLTVNSHFLGEKVMWYTVAVTERKNRCRRGSASYHDHTEQVGVAAEH